MDESQQNFLDVTRRRALGALLFATGAVLSGCGLSGPGERAKSEGRILLSGITPLPEGLEQAVRFPLMEAMYGRRSRRFPVGGEIPDGVMAYKSTEPVMPLDELEQMMVLTAVGGNTGWHHLIYRHKKYAPYLSNYSGAAGGRTFPSAAGVHTSQIFYTDDNGTYFFPTRDLPSQVALSDDGTFDLKSWLDAHKKVIRKLSDTRLYLPPEEPYVEGHNTWIANHPGSTFIFPVADLAQHELALLCFLVQNGYCICDDIAGTKIDGLEKFRDIVDVDHPYPLSFVERYALTEATVELATACYAGALTLQALGLGGWMYDGIDPYTVLGASGRTDVPGFGFRYDTREDWALPNVTGLPGVFEAYCPPHYSDMRAAVDALVERKYGPGGPFNAATPGPFKDSAKVRAAAAPMDEKFRACVATMAQAIYDRYGKFPGTHPSVFHLMYLQAQHIDLGFYNTHFAPGAYLETHRNHMKWWHGRT